MPKKAKKFSSSIKVILSAIYIIGLSFLLNHYITSTRPVVFCSILVIGVFISLAIFHSFGWFELSHRNLFNQPLFWISIFIPLYLFFSIGIWSWKGHSINFTSDGFNNFLTISKLPLLFLASSVPLTSIVNNIHRTIQTEKQISETEKKNTSDSYFTHFKYTTELFESLKSENITWDILLKLQHGTFPRSYENTNLTIKSPIRLYKKIFHQSNAFDGGNYNVDANYISQIKQHWLNINNEFEKLLASRNIHEYIDRVSDSAEAIKSINIDYISICKLLFISGYHSGRSFDFQEQHEHFRMITTFSNEINMYQCLKSLDSITESIFEIILVASVNEDFNLEKKHFNFKMNSFHEWKPDLMITTVLEEHQEPLILINRTA